MHSRIKNMVSFPSHRRTKWLTSTELAVHTLLSETVAIRVSVPMKKRSIKYVNQKFGHGLDRGLTESSHIIGAGLGAALILDCQRRRVLWLQEKAVHVRTNRKIWPRRRQISDGVPGWTLFQHSWAVSYNHTIKFIIIVYHLLFLLSLIMLIVEETTGALAECRTSGQEVPGSSLGWITFSVSLSKKLNPSSHFSRPRSKWVPAITAWRGIACDWPASHPGE
jgi:hypothetical protein